MTYIANLWIAIVQSLKPKPRVRLAHKWGNGDWFPAKRETQLYSWAEYLNEKYGPDTHWVEEEK